MPVRLTHLYCFYTQFLKMNEHTFQYLTYFHRQIQLTKSVMRREPHNDDVET